MTNITIILTALLLLSPVSPQTHLLETNTQIPNFEYTTLQGVKINRDSLKGKYWLVEFWASWCLPCRRQHPSMNAMLEKLNQQDSGLESRFGILGISFDKDTSAWRKSIFNDKLHWTHQVCDTLYWDSPTAKKFQLGHLPYNFIIDENGMVQGQELYGSGLEEKLRLLLDL